MAEFSYMQNGERLNARPQSILVGYGSLIVLLLTSYWFSIYVFGIVSVYRGVAGILSSVVPQQIILVWHTCNFNSRGVSIRCRFQYKTNLNHSDKLDNLERKVMRNDLLILNLLGFWVSFKISFWSWYSMDELQFECDPRSVARSGSMYYVSITSFPVNFFLQFT